MTVKRNIIRIVQKIIKMTKEKEILPIPVPIDTKQVLKGKVALITGGSSGIGLAIAKSFQNSGCKVIIAGTKEEKLAKCLEILPESKGITLDVMDVRAMPEKIQLAASLFPENRIDILVNSAGIVSQSSFWDISENEYDDIMDINTKGTFFMSREISKYMIKKKIKGHILNISSSSALRPAWTPYQMSKWAVRGLTLGLADTLLPHGIVVNAIAPGPTSTPMFNKGEGDTIYNADSPCKRYAVPSEIAALATFMVSDMGNLIIGDTFYMTGGSGTITYHS